jgi:hypothetical protein
MSADDLILLRSKMAIARFFPEESDKLVNFIATAFTQRLSNGEGVGDIADVYGKVIDESKVLSAAVTLIQQKDQTSAAQQVLALTQDERLILTQYV